MTTYAKFINETNIEFPPKNKGNIINYDLNVEELTKDGYKEFIEAQKDPSKNYTITYVVVENQIREIAIEVIPDPAELLKEAKEQKISENDNLRDIALNQGVVYRDVLFDSDTDQKVNLLATVSMMNNTDTVEWFGMDNQPLLCTKQDLINIGGLITQLHSFCWEKNYEIKTAINEAETVEEVQAIEINYNLESEGK